jgi:hypothetical protein
MFLFVFSNGAWADILEKDFAPLFDGKTLNGWEGDEETWSVRDGMIVGKTESVLKENQFLCTTERYKDFELRFDIRLINGRGNTGVQFRSERVPDSTEVSGYQADYGHPYWGGLYDESRRNRILKCPDPELLRSNKGQYERMLDKTPSPEAKTFFAALKKDGWNEYTIRAEGNHITLKINGITSVSYTEEDPQIAREGVFGLQVHSGPPIEVQFKNLRIKKLGE